MFHFADTDADGYLKDRPVCGQRGRTTRTNSLSAVGCTRCVTVLAARAAIAKRSGR